MTPLEVKELNNGRYTFRKDHSSTKSAPYKKLPGHVLVEEFLVPFYPAELSDLATRTKIPLQRYRKLIRGQDRIDPVMADALGKFYQNGAQFWLDLQERFERGEAL
jgi:plasmid maintenance system antidote protein VapI